MLHTRPMSQGHRMFSGPRTGTRGTASAAGSRRQMRSSVQGLPDEVDRESGADVQAARRAPPARTYHSSMEVLEPEEWQARAEAHRRRVEAWAAPHLARRMRGESHPIEDFLFTY